MGVAVLNFILFRSKIEVNNGNFPGECTLRCYTVYAWRPVLEIDFS